MELGHLSRRFFGAIRAKSLAPDDAAWVVDNLLPGEQELWARMSVADQEHACGVARDVVRRLAENATRPVIAAALLHDIGKVDTPIGTFGRVMATLAGHQASREQIDSWSKEKGWLGDAGRYLRHNETGAELLAAAGSDPLTVAWAREHELPQKDWTIPADIADALWAADNR